MEHHYPESKEGTRLKNIGRKRSEERVRNSLGMNVERIWPKSDTDFRVDL